ncbi:MAG: nicotinamide-nucleotide amidohydrolase family protein, partial [Phycisphaerae bacterium]
NARGTAPGFWHDGDAARLFVLPGVPVEMKAMFAQAVAPLVDPGGGVGAGGVGSCARVARLLTFGASEARVGDMLADMMAAERNPSLGTTASGAVITVRIVAYGRDAATADRLVDGDVAEVRRRLGHAVFGADEDTLQDAVARLLIAQGRTIATAESCTGGLLAKRLTDVPGASGYFLRGVVAYANDAKTALLGVPGDVIASEGAVSEAVARAMADGCRRLAGSDLAVSITGIAGPDGGSPPDRPVGLVYIGVADRDGVAVRRFVFGSHLTRAEVRDRSCKTALNLVRLQLLDAAPT